MVYLFTNCYRYLNDSQFQLDLENAGFKDSDIFVFLNTCVPYKHAPQFFNGRKIYTIHRQKGETASYFGIDDIDAKNAVKLKLNNDGMVFNGNVSVKIKLGYTVGKIPTTGFFAYYFCVQFFGQPVTLVNFFGSADTSTTKWQGHDWHYEEKIIDGIQGKIYMDELPINYRYLKDYTSFLEGFDCVKKHYVIDDIMFDTEYGYAETIGKLGMFLPGFEYIKDVERYKKFPGNEHHWTTGFAWRTILPKIMADLGVREFNPEDFVLKKNFEKSANVSYHCPKRQYRFLFRNMEGNYSRSGYSETLRCLAKKRSKYHELYAGQHCVSYVKNKDSSSGRRLMINCDSMAIPLIPVLACYFDEVMAIDNRSGKKFADEIRGFGPTHYVGLGLYRNYTDHSFNKKLPKYINAESNNKIIFRNIM